MEAVIKTGGKQYIVKEGDHIQIEKTSFEVGSEIGFDDILLITDKDKVHTDSSKLKSFKVKASKMVNFNTSYITNCSS